MICMDGSAKSSAIWWSEPTKMLNSGSDLIIAKIMLSPLGIPAPKQESGNSKVGSPSGAATDASGLRRPLSGTASPPLHPKLLNRLGWSRDGHVPPSPKLLNPA